MGSTNHAEGVMIDVVIAGYVGEAVLAVGLLGITVKMYADARRGR